ncbi:hypothetical protein N2152v2_008409 [Parachlorella kessleri]
MRTGCKVFLLLTLCHLAAGRQLLVRISPDEPPVTVPYSLPEADSAHSSSGLIPDVGLWVLAPENPGIDPQQVHVTNWAPGSLLFSWVTGSAQVGPEVTLPPVKSVASWVEYGPESGQYNETIGGTVNSTAYLQIYKNATLGALSYASPIIHHVLVTGLEPGETIFYRVGDPAYLTWSDEFSVTVPPLPTVENLPFRIAAPAPLLRTNSPSDGQGSLNVADHLQSVSSPFHQTAVELCRLAQHGSSLQGIMGDLGQTENSNQTLQQLMANEPQLVWLVGNHEIEPMLATGGSAFTSYNARWPNPQNPSVVNTSAGHAVFSPQPQDYMPGPGTDVNGYYSQDIPGAHVIWLNAHIAYWTGTAQYEWFLQDIASVDRTATPWLIINLHAQFYASYVSQYKCTECMRELYEPIFYAHQVDLVISGHVHSYERSKPMYNYTLDECGPMYLVVGDGGNDEGLTNTFIDEDPPAYCNDTSLYPYTWFVPTPTGYPPPPPS